ncbi:putative tetratricopeptide-like helical domain-containing protein [Medicago truncatula]|uniref:PPR containing plant protein n=1 Tax=Medicago truncatula TaxID=3880 RepID=A0A072URS9_MEDTR|nr:pentatricopeptide repeat-containing protein At3g48250, chloroplastic [Medicago truncatula]KEH31768.1 PPR containing plant protein [Medicago truncatula]RHN63450.1 putative tetratricopeptide-like helical domain-containing protein [Medicago truncatula]
MKALESVARNLRFINSLLTIRVTTTRSLHQVSHFSLYTPPPLFIPSPFHDSRFHQTHYVSSKPNSIVELIQTNAWSQGFEKELENCYPSLTHETVVYILKQLDNDPLKASCFFNWVSKKNWFLPSSSLCNLILRILANKDTIEQFWIHLRMMRKKGFYLDRITYRSILEGFRREKMNRDFACLKTFFKNMVEENARQVVFNKVVSVILGSEWGDEVVNELVELKIQFSDSFVIRVLKELRSCPLKGYNFFYWVGKQSGYQHNAVTYNAVARVLARMDSIEEFWSILAEMKSVNYELEIDTYMKITMQFVKNQMMKDAVKLYELMMDGSYEPSVHDCCFLLNAIATSDSPNSDLVFRVAKKYESAGYTLTKEIYDGIHRCLTSVGKFDKAENIVKTMRNGGHEPDNTTYSQLVFGLCKMKRVEEACKVLEEMESSGCIPDNKTWSIFIQGHCAANALDKALLCLSKMIEKDCNPDAAAIDALVDSFLSQEKIDNAYKFLVEMVEICASPRQCTYEKLIQNLLGIGKFEDALDLLCLMRKHKYSPFNKPIVQYVSKFGTVEDAEKFLKAWRKGSPRSHSAYLHVLESFIGEGRLSEVKDLLCKFPSQIKRHKKINEFFSFSGDSDVASAT